VIGQPVTPEQAAEIIIRTDRFMFTANDKPFTEELMEAAGVERDTHGWCVYESRDRAAERYGVLDLEYLVNDQIVSSYIGGPHGWCNWNGSIFTNSYNIGKWPSVETVESEWKLIAETFPYLFLRAQLFSGEQCEEGIVPVVEFQVAHGEVSTSLPGPPIPITDEPFDAEAFFRVGRERGCDIGQFKWALSLAERAVAAA
jgi:hypothetical protein